MALVAAVLAVALSMSGTAHALVIWDQSPAAVNGVYNGPFQNVATAQNFADQVLFASGVVVQGMDIYTTPPVFSVLGESVTIRIRADKPDGNLLEFTGKIDAVDGIGTTDESQRRLHAMFEKPIDLLADTIYWFGMSSSATTKDIGQLAVQELTFKQLAVRDITAPSLDGRMAQYRGLTFVTFTPAGDMLFRLEGAPVAVPEPGTLAFLGAGLAALAFARRRKRR